MAITTYAELQTAMSNWLNRSDLTSRLPEMIALAEPRMRRLLRDKTTVAASTTAGGADTITLPAAVKELLSVRYNTGTFEYPLIKMSAQALAGVRSTGSGRPLYYAVVGSTLLWDVTPDSNYTLELVYVEAITPLSNSNTTNSTLTNSPDIYLYGSLAESAPFLEHDDRVAMWEQRFLAAIDDENNARERQDLGGTPQMGLPVVFGDPC